MHRERGRLCFVYMYSSLNEIIAFRSVFKDNSLVSLNRTNRTPKPIWMINIVAVVIVFLSFFLSFYLSQWPPLSSSRLSLIVNIWWAKEEIFFLVHVHRLLVRKKKERNKKACLSICSFKQSTNEIMFRSANRKREE